MLYYRYTLIGIQHLYLGCNILYLFDCYMLLPFIYIYEKGGHLWLLRQNIKCLHMRLTMTICTDTNNNNLICNVTPQLFLLYKFTPQ